MTDDQNKQPIEEQVEDILESHDDDQQQSSQHQDDQIAELQDKLMRAQADFVNFRERARKEKEEFATYSQIRFIEGLIPIIDTLHQAMTHMPEEIASNNWSQGIQHFKKMLDQYVTELGVTPIEITPLETVFDPMKHEAIAQEDHEAGPDLITEVIQPGYSYKNDKVIRPAKVKVSR